jgi:hypothetical protein
VMEDELEFEPADRQARVAGAGHDVLGLAQTSAIRLVAGAQTESRRPGGEEPPSRGKAMGLLEH